MRGTHRRGRSALLATLGFVMALTVGCSSKVENPPAAKAPSTTSAGPEADLAAAQRANLVAADFPSGWSSKAHEKQPLEDEIRAEIAACLGISLPSTRATAEARSPDFTQGFATASSVVTFVGSEAEAAADAEAFSGDKFGPCAHPGFGRQMHEVGPEGNTVEDVSAQKLDLPAHGDRSVAHRIMGTLHFGEARIPINVDIVNIFKDRAEVELIVVAPGTPFPSDFVSGLAAAIAGRL